MVGDAQEHGAPPIKHVLPKLTLKRRTFWVVIFHSNNSATCAFCMGDDGVSIQGFNGKQVNDADRNIWRTAITRLVYEADLE